MKIGGIGLLKELNFKSISKNKLQNRNVFYYEILVTGSPLSSFQTSAHLPPLHSRVSLGLPAVLSELLTLIWRAPVVMLTSVPCSPLRGSSLLRSHPFSLPPACTAFLHREQWAFCNPKDVRFINKPKMEKRTKGNSKKLHIDLALDIYKHSKFFSVWNLLHQSIDMDWGPLCAQRCAERGGLVIKIHSLYFRQASGTRGIKLPKKPSLKARILSKLFSNCSLSKISGITKHRVLNAKCSVQESGLEDCQLQGWVGRRVGKEGAQLHGDSPPRPHPLLPPPYPQGSPHCTTKPWRSLTPLGLCACSSPA